MQMIDLREATKTLDAYSTSIIGKSRFYDQTLKFGAPEEIEKITEGMIAELKAETKEAMIILMMVMEEVIRHSTQLVAAFPDELAEWYEAINRSRAATNEAKKVTLAHKEKFQRKRPEESPSAKMIREFRAARNGHSHD
ncbi:MAG: hypothetical protein JWP25_4340 [Bradyrhizobium sp.]|nr:hypothetical protein [Bradyrhizobium sp.]